jgi:hypothetical protein
MHEFVVHRFRASATVADAVQTQVRGDAVEQARRELCRQAVAPPQDLDEDILRRVEGVTLLVQQLPAPAQHHGAVCLVERFDVHGSSGLVLL